MRVSLSVFPTGPGCEGSRLGPPEPRGADATDARRWPTSAFVTAIVLESSKSIRKILSSGSVLFVRFVTSYVDWQNLREQNFFSSWSTVWT